MHKLYLIRHGNADYYRNRLTELGQQQVKDLSSKLSSHLPDNKRYSLVSSPSGRAYETAEGLVQLVRKKACNEVQIKKNSSFSELESMGSDEEMFETGKQKVPIVMRYGESCDVLIITAHESIIAATGIAVAESHGLKFPEDFGRIKQYTEDRVREYIEGLGLSRDAAVKKINEFLPDELPPVKEASAIYCDFDARQVEIINPALDGCLK